MGVIENIQSLITAANTTTGKTDADMTEATKSLIAGYGGGGKPEEVKTVDIVTNGTTEILPTPGYAMSKVVANVNVPTGGGMETGTFMLDVEGREVTAPVSHKCTFFAIYPNSQADREMILKNKMAALVCIEKEAIGFCSGRYDNLPATGNIFLWNSNTNDWYAGNCKCEFYDDRIVSKTSQGTSDGYQAGITFRWIAF